MFQDRAKNIKYNGYFVEDERSLPGWRRFWSADIRFPITIACPPGSGPYLNREDSQHLILETESGFTVQRRYPVHEDVVSFMENWAERWLDQRRQLSDSPFASEADRAPYKDAYKYRIVDRGPDQAVVSDQAFRAPRIIFTRRAGLFGASSGEVVADWVFFARRAINEVWAILRDARELDEDDFQAILASFRWLNDD